MRTYRVRIEGTSSLLIHRFGEEAQQGKTTRKISAVNETPREKAQKAVYVTPEGLFYFNAFAIPNAMGNAGSNHKQTGTRKTLRWVVPTAVRTMQDTIVILKGNKPAPDFEVDARPVTIPATKGRVMRYRPRFDGWAAEFELVINDDLLDPQMAHQLLNEAGLGVGIGDFRPEKRGPFGCFNVTMFKEVK